MNTNDTLHFDTVRIGRFVETAVYAGLAAVLIGQIFSHQGPITLADAGSVMLGAVFGLLAFCGGAPLSGWLSRWMGNRQDDGAVSPRRSAEVLTFSTREPNGGESEDTRRAA